MTPKTARAFANPEVYEFLETEGYGHTIRLPANEVLQREIEPLLTRPVGRPSNAPVVWYADFLYQAQSWERARRVVGKVCCLTAPPLGSRNYCDTPQWQDVLSYVRNEMGLKR